MYQRSLSSLLTLGNSVQRSILTFSYLPTHTFQKSIMTDITVNGYEDLNNLLKAQNGKVFILFSGSPNNEGVSWCPDCVKADPVIARNLNKLPSDAILIHCLVGDRTYWKNPTNEFRKDPKFAIRCVPTLLKLGSSHKLEEGQCLSDDLIQMLFEDDDD